MSTIVSPYVDAMLETPHGQMSLTCCQTYSTDDPLAVTFTFVVEVQLEGGHIGRDVQSWTIARELVEAALANPPIEVGQGDVRLQYLTDQHILVMTLLDLENHQHDIYIDACYIPQFMEESALLIPAELNVVDDDEIAALMEAGE